MINKPLACQECPAYTTSQYWVPDQSVDGAEVCILLPDVTEYDLHGTQVIQRIGRQQYETQPGIPAPACGPLGYDLSLQWFPLAGLVRHTTSLASTLRCQIRTDLPQPDKKLAYHARGCCHTTHFRPPDSTRLIVACGQHAAMLMGCPGSIHDWRGHILPQRYNKIPVLCVMDLAELQINPKLTVACIKDWKKIPRILEGEWPTPLPARKEYLNDEGDRQWFTHALQAPYCSVDTEYTVNPPGQASTLSLIGLAIPDHTTLYIWWPSVHSQAFLQQFKVLIATVPTVMWNATADIPVLESALGVRYQDYYRIEDPMLKHALLWSELSHTLESCAAADGKYPKLKHLMSQDLALYNQGDVLETAHLNQVYDRELEADPQTRHVYETQALPLIPVILKSIATGVRVHQQRVLDLLQQFQGTLQQAQQMAQQACGHEINLGSSKQIQAYIYTEKGYPVQKHYKTKRPTANQDAINALRSTFLPVDQEYEEQEGVLYEDIVERLRSGADPFLESVALFSSVRNLVSTYLFGLCHTIYHEMDENKRKRARKLLGNRLLVCDDICSRVYPDYKQHAQANGRWSITDPPLAGMPKVLHPCFIPDPGYPWIKYDFKQIEPRIRACTTKDTPRLKAFERGDDIYEATCYEMFGKYSKTLRKLGKVVELALSYGKQPRNLHHVPGIMGYGFQRKDLTRAAENYLRAHPEQTRWMESHIAAIHRQGYSRESVGHRKRNLLGHWGDQEREGLNQPMQAGAASLTNYRILAITQACPSVTLVNNRFDEHWWAVPIKELDTVRQTMIQILNQPWVINGITMQFPVDPPELTVIYAPEDL